MNEPAGDELLREKFIGGMSHAANTVNIVTTDGAAGRAGVTVSAMSSVSADTPKPTLLVCVHHLSPAAQTIIDNGVFCVNILRDDQSYISDTFAGRFKDVVEDKFDCADWAAMTSGAPRVRDPLVAFDCRVVSCERMGTHHVFFGEVLEVFNAKRGSPLIYANRSYGAASRIDRAASIAAGKSTSEMSLTIGVFHTFGPYILPEIVKKMMAQEDGLKIGFIEGDQRRVKESLLSGESDVALMYDFDLPPDFDIVPLTALVPYVLLAKGHPLAEKPELTPQDLAGEPMILLDTPPSREYFTGMMENVGLEPQIAFRSTSFEMVRGMVGRGLGFSLLATKPASSMSYDGQALVTRPLKTNAPPSHIVLVTRKNTKHTYPARLFMEHCFDVFGIERNQPEAI